MVQNGFKQKSKTLISVVSVTSQICCIVNLLEGMNGYVNGIHFGIRDFISDHANLSEFLIKPINFLWFWFVFLNFSISSGGKS